VNRIQTVLVDEPDALPAALEPLSSLDHVAIDTEFMRERTYYPQLCLIQVANAAGCVLIDPVAIGQLDPLCALLRERSRMKVLHAARQDLEVLSLNLGFVPGPIFDTQVAAGLLGLPAQIGYGELVRRQLGRELVKGHARTDWARRPLSTEQLAYAADDVRYLVPLHAELCRRLEAKGRLAWLFEETSRLEDPALYAVAPGEAWRRLKGLDRLRPEQRAAARALAGWREALARNTDKPRGWILSDEALRALAEMLPRSRADLDSIAGLPPAVIRKRGDELLELTGSAAREAPHLDATPASNRPSPAQVAKVTALMRKVRASGERLEISPELLATRRDVERLVYSQDPGQLARGWRADVIGRELLAAADSRTEDG
jgi:ribonuclease D